MTFSRLTKMKLFDELLDRRQKGNRCPSLAWIAKFAKLGDDGEAESLLLDMQRDNVLTILGKGPYPWVELSRLSYGGRLVAGMMLDPERFDQKPEPAPLIIKAAPDPKSIPSAARTADDEIDELVSAVEERVTPRTPIKRVNIDATEALGTARKAPNAEESTSASTAAATAIERDVSRAEEPEPVAAALPAPEEQASPQPVEARQRDLLLEVEAFLAKHGIAPSTFSKKVMDQSMFVAKLRGGLQPQGKTVDRVRRYMAEYTPPAARATFKCGHARTPENSHENGHGYKRCKECSRITKRDWKRAKVAAAEIPLIGRPHVRTAVLRQWEAEGRPPLNAFLTDLLDLGLEARTTFQRAA
ncbi:MAG: hypothetical protein V4530_06180 [Pseudomonadota bacterium]